MAGKSQRCAYVSRSWEIDLALFELRMGDARVPLGSRVFEILEVLVESAGELLSKGDLVGRVWQGAIAEESTIQFPISAIRKALGADRKLLKTDSGGIIGCWATRPW